MDNSKGGALVWFLSAARKADELIDRGSELKLYLGSECRELLRRGRGYRSVGQRAWSTGRFEQQGGLMISMWPRSEQHNEK